MATLKISDLSVGDWVEYEGLHYPITFVGYGEGGDGSLVNLIRPDLSCFTCKISDIRPIPITAETLEANGFEFDKASRWHICELEDKTRINVWIGRNNEGRIEVSKPALFDDMYNFKCADIEVSNIAVHQLQHVLRLAGVDKEINL